MCSRSSSRRVSSRFGDDDDESAAQQELKGGVEHGVNKYVVQHMKKSVENRWVAGRVPLFCRRRACMYVCVCVSACASTL